MSYTINVSLDGRHYFTTDKHSIVDAPMAIRLATDFKNRFPASEGFEIQVYYMPLVSYGVDITNLTGRKLIKSIEKLYK